MRVEGQINKLREQAKVLRKEKYCKEKLERRQQHKKLTIQMEEINKKILAKETWKEKLNFFK